MPPLQPQGKYTQALSKCHHCSHREAIHTKPTPLPKHTVNHTSVNIITVATEKLYTASTKAQMHHVNTTIAAHCHSHFSQHHYCSHRGIFDWNWYNSSSLNRCCYIIWRFWLESASSTSMLCLWWKYCWFSIKVLLAYWLAYSSKLFRLLTTIY